MLGPLRGVCRSAAPALDLHPSFQSLVVGGSGVLALARVPGGVQLILRVRSGGCEGSPSS